METLNHNIDLISEIDDNKELVQPLKEFKNIETLNEDDNKELVQPSKEFKKKETLKENFLKSSKRRQIFSFHENKSEIDKKRSTLKMIEGNKRN